MICEGSDISKISDIFHHTAFRGPSDIRQKSLCGLRAQFLSHAHLMISSPGTLGTFADLYENFIVCCMKDMSAFPQTWKMERVTKSRDRWILCWAEGETRPVNFLESSSRVTCEKDAIASIPHYNIQTSERIFGCTDENSQVETGCICWEILPTYICGFWERPDVVCSIEWSKFSNSQEQEFRCPSRSLRIHLLCSENQINSQQLMLQTASSTNTQIGTSDENSQRGCHGIHLLSL